MSKYDVEILESFSDEELMDEVNERGLKSDIKEFDDSDLKKTLEDRGFYVFDEDPTDEDIDLDDVELADIVDHIKGHDYMVIEGNKMADFISDLPSYKLKDLLCDVVGVNHHTSKDEVLKLLSEKF